MADFRVIWPRNEAFVGRQQLLDDLHAYVSKTVGGQHTATLIGPTGIGKTQLAVEYAYQYAEHYPGGVYWIEAGREWTHELASLAAQLGLKPARPTRSISERDRWLTVALQRYLADEQPEAVLLIFNDVHDPHAVLDREIGPGLHVADMTAHLLITTSVDAADIPGSFRSFAVGPLDDATASQIVSDLVPQTGRVPLTLKLVATALDSGASEAMISDVLMADDDPLDAMLGWHLEVNQISDIVRLATAFFPQTVFSMAWLRLMTSMSREQFTARLETLQEAGLIEMLHDQQFEVRRAVQRYIREHDTDYRQPLRRGAELLVQAYRDPTILMQQALERGVMALLSDLGEVRRALREEGSPPAALIQLLRFLEWEADHPPQYLIQHLRERAHHQQDDELRDVCDDWLIHSQSHFATEDAWRYPRNPSVLGTYIGHEARITDVMALDNRCLVTTSHDMTLRLWDMISGHTVRVFHGHQGGVTCVARLDDEHVVSGSADGTLRVWHVTSGELVSQIEAHKWSVTAVAICPNAVLVSGGADDALRVWDLPDGRLRYELEGHTEPITAVAIWDELHILSAAHDGRVLLWNVETGQRAKMVATHETSVTAIAVVDSQRLLAACSDGGLYLWDVTAGTLVERFSVEGVRLSDVVVMNNQLAVVASSDYALRVWDLATGEVQLVLHGHTRPVTKLALLDQQHVVSVSSDLTMRLWDVVTPQPPLRTQSIHTDWVTALLPLKDGRLLSASADHYLRISQDGQVISSLAGHHDGVNAVVQIDNGLVISAASDGTLRIWDVARAETVLVLKGHDDEVLSVAVVGDSYVLSGSLDGTVRLWDHKTGEQLAITESPPIMVMLALPDGRVFCGAEDGRLLLWQDGDFHGEITAHKSAIRDMALLTDDYMLTASSDRSVRLWHLETGELVRTFTGHREWVNAISVVDEQHFVSASFDGTLRLWNREESSWLALLKVGSPLLSLARLDHNRVVVGDVVGRLRVLRCSMMG